MQLSAKAGESFSIELDATVGTCWYYRPCDGASLIETRAEPNTQIAGGQIKQIFIFTCPGIGAHELQFDLRRPWESQVRRTEVINVSIT